MVVVSDKNILIKSNSEDDGNKFKDCLDKHNLIDYKRNLILNLRKLLWTIPNIILLPLHSTCSIKSTYKKKPNYPTKLPHSSKKFTLNRKNIADVINNSPKTSRYQHIIIECAECERVYASDVSLKLHVKLKHTNKNSSELNTNEKPVECRHYSTSSNFELSI